MAEECPMMGSGDLPLAVGRYRQAPAADRLPLPGGGWTQAHKLYMIGLLAGTATAAVLGGPYRTDAELEAAMRGVELQPPAPVQKKKGRR